MLSLQDTVENNSGSLSVSKAEDNLSSSDDQILNQIPGRSNVASNSIEQISYAQSTKSSSKDLSIISHMQSLTSYDHDKKRYCLWTLTLILAILGILNMLMSIVIMHVLRVSKGMESLEIISDKNLMKFYGRTDLDNIYLEKGIVEGYGNIPMTLNGDNSGIKIRVKNIRHKNPKAEIEISKNGTKITRVESFNVKDKNGNLIFSTNFPNFELPKGVKNINVKIAQTHRIVSPLNKSLRLESNRQVELHGAESLSMEGKEVIWMADNDIRLKSNSSIVIDGKNGIFIDTKKIPIASTQYPQNDKLTGQYKICVCMPQGKLYKIPVSIKNTRINCDNIRTPDNDPCLD
ncbi:hypothetical protein HCN44_005360 [Aphidius gifuensis]|uniref:Beta-sarcoglycan n=1 Tax=Aphidius gifuensis TaxID=684658 RepID=A0A835CX40_APHGI|nr:uncharacterized protein LOC122855921 [Aphidius gifuensis]KAF7997083.1 hypothetical protein HCN44_005360 [Aphidius gifuensis]